MNPFEQTGRPPWFPPPGGIPPSFGQPGQPPTSQPKPAGESGTAVPEPLVAKNITSVKDFYPMPLEGIPGERIEGFQLTGHRLIEGKLLLDFQYKAWIDSYDKKGEWQSSDQKTFVGMALFNSDTKRWSVAMLTNSFREPLGFTPQQSVLWRGTLYSSHLGEIMKYDFQKNAWQPAGFAAEGGQLYNLDGRLYRTDNNSIEEITENGHATKLLASIQRQPPVSSLDSQGALMNLVLFNDAQKQLCASVHNRIYRWDRNDWLQICATETSAPSEAFEDGVLYASCERPTLPGSPLAEEIKRLSGFNKRSNEMELYLEQITELSPYPYKNKPDLSKKTVWKFPTGLSLPNNTAALWQSDLYLMTDYTVKRDISNEYRQGTEYTAKDGYNAALFCFSRDLPAALKIRYFFEAKDACPPPAGVEYGPMADNRAWMLFTTNLMFCAQDRVRPNFKPGIWVVSTASIASEINALKQIQLQQPQQENAKVSLVSQTPQTVNEPDLQAFLNKYDHNHNGVIDPNEQDEARDDPYFMKYYLAKIHAQK